ncbi:MAG TPA: D-arabinono-1,4-lactone oxidase [Kofleriaceae bacterium]|jgi:FAD/FMN-containing dehydrogenase|nr:D-arabinono-1,4-lactone oxidase [Kofleriaceae bacterium]
MKIDDRNIPAGSAPTWQNWSGNIRHVPPTDGEHYYFTPKHLTELMAVVADARQRGVTVRASGQRHSQPPLVADDNRSAPPPKPRSYLVDMSCYVDVGDNGIALGPGAHQITVNPGVREDAVDAFLTRHDLMFNTVTAGGFFSLGGMTAVDVHGGTVEAPIFAETASSFVILGADGQLRTIDATSPCVGDWSPLQFARVALGGLGIVIRMTLDVLPRPYATTLRGGMQRHLLKDKQAFAAAFTAQLTGPSKHGRMEVFYTPYAAAPNLPFPPLPNFLVLWWDVVDNPEPKIPNAATHPQTACALSQAGDFGAPFLGGIGGYAAKWVRESQYFSNPYNPFHFPPVPTAGFAAIALDEIESQAGAANKVYSDLWLTEASQVIFMSYFIELPALDTAGLDKVWDGLDVVARRVIQDDNFHIAAPMEFRFIKAGNSAMAGTYSQTPDAWFVNLDLIGFIEATPSADYPAKLLQFFADVERDWVAIGGFPHQGKMYGFYDPTMPAGTHTAAFNPNFLADLRRRRGERLKAFDAYRKAQDPTGLFYNDFLRQLLEG